MIRLALQVSGLALIVGGTGWAQVTQRVSLDSAGAQGNDHSFMAQAIASGVSADGRYVVFWSVATNLVPGDTNGAWDIFITDRQNGTTERMSVDSNGIQGNHNSLNPSISADGRYVAFESHASNLVPDDTNSDWDVFVHDTITGQTTRISVDSNGNQANGDSYAPSLSSDGRYVTFFSSAPDLVAGDTNGALDVFVRDRQNGTTERVSVDSSGAQGDGDSNYASISGDGRYVAFESWATNLVPADTDGTLDVFVRDRQNGTTERVSVDSSGAQGDGGSNRTSISGDGRYVAFESSATNLVPADTNGALDVFVRDRQNATTERMSVDSSGAQGDGDSHHASISGDGRHVAFESWATNLVPADTDGTLDVFVRDRQNATTERMSVDSGGTQGNGGESDSASISTDGRFVAFHSFAHNLVPGDTNTFFDVFVHDRNATSFSSLCDPGVDGVIVCPCANPPSGSGRGCDNSAATGGAMLAASGVAYLSMDSLVFTTSGETPAATSFVLQGASLTASGLVYGQGVRCVGGTLKKLFSRTASGGSITAPDFGAGDATVSGRSAASGDVILPGQSRWYLVFYRDPAGCPRKQYLGTAVRGFNATQTGQVTWSL